MTIPMPLSAHHVGATFARRAPALQAVPQRPDSRVLRTRHAPAQLSLFARPGASPR